MAPIQPGEGQAPAAPEAVTDAGGLRLPVAVWATLWMLVWVGGAVLMHFAVRGVVNVFQVLLSIFLAINVMICVWEMCLLFRIDAIEERYRLRQQGGGRGAGRRGRSFFLSRVAFRELGSATLWSRVWSEYALYDPSYADRRSFGFAIDVGNGFSTLLPSLVFLFGMTFGFLSPGVLGIIGLLVFYQKFYGTLLYFFTYLFNRRYAGQRLANVLAFVGGINGIWLVFPAVGLYVCVRLLLEGRFDVLWS
jgi:uncharacterized protein YqgC (DUF456 family)